MRKLHIIFSTIFLVICGNFYAQYSENIILLEKKLAAAKHDTDKINHLINLSLILSNSDFEKSIKYGKEAYDLSKKINLIKGEISALNSIADSYWFHSENSKAQEYYFKAYRIADSLNIEDEIAFSLYNIGWIKCIQQHQFKESKYLYKSYGIYKKLNDNKGLLRIYNALASYYTDVLSTEKDKRYFDSSITYFKKGITLANQMNLYEDLGRLYGNIGDLFYREKDIKSAIFYTDKSIEIHRKTKDSTSIMLCLTNKALFGLETNDVQNSIKWFNQILSYSKHYGLKDLQVSSLNGLSKAYALTNDFKTAYNTYNQYSELKNEVDVETYSNKLSSLQTSYNLEKSEASIKELTQEKEIQELKNKKNTYFIFGLLAVAFIVVVVAFLLFKQNKQKQSANLKLTEQNKIIAEKKQEIEQSIQYAKGIQQSVLPNIQELKTNLSNSFVYYKPKDVVSGDFYWFGKLNNDFYCVAADCTGHGVPGALMSIIGIEKLTQIIFEKNITEPGKILAYLNIEIKRILKQHSDSSKQMDGMDLAFLKFNHSYTKVEYAGANRPLWIVRKEKNDLAPDNKTTNYSVIEYKADKIAIAGYTPDEQVFKTTVIDLQKEDQLFLFTDGYADQFGGDSGKKFMTKNLKELFINLSQQPTNKQEEIIDNTFKTWKGSYEQVDDVLIIGLKVS